MNTNKYNIELNKKIGFRISIASPLQILKWAYKKIDNIIITGKITEPYTLNYITGIPEPNGLFCERIFGPINSWQCYCGFFNKNNIIFKPHICTICGYENNSSIIRRYRMGYIHLQTPLAHTWYLYNIIPYFLDSSYDNIYYYLYYLILDKWMLEYKKEDKYNNIKYIFASEYIQHKLKQINIIQKYLILKNLLYSSFNVNKRKQLVKTINFFNLFILNNISPSWLMLDVLPVIPAGIRPLLHSNVNNIIMSPLNELYRLIILKNNKLNRWYKLRGLVPITFELIEKRNLQKLVDSLLEISNVKNNTSSLTAGLKGKYNKFRQYILGKRVDFSGRSVIISGPDLNVNDIGLPLNICLDLFKPILLNILKKNSILNTILQASYFIDYSFLILKRLLYYIMRKEVLLVNRAPTLHRMNIQSFKPSIIEHEAIKLYPLACSGFNADFDGDQMGLFLVLSESAKKEAKRIMLFEKNMFSPYYTKNMFKYSQSILLGLNTLSSIKGDSIHTLIFSSIEDALKVYNHKLIKLNTLILIKYKIQKALNIYNTKKYVCTTLGRLLLQNLS